MSGVGCGENPEEATAKVQREKTAENAEKDGNRKPEGMISDFRFQISEEKQIRDPRPENREPKCVIRDLKSEI